MMKHKNFGVFILTHGRPDNVETIKLLKSIHYSGKIYLIMDDEDTTIEKYKKNFKNDKNIKFFIFSKKDSICDLGDNSGKRNVVIFARNKCFDIANELGLDYFLELDDDYSEIQYKIPDKDKLRAISIKNKNIGDELFDAYLDFLDSDERIKCIAMSQGGDFIGGNENKYTYKGLTRKVMNSFFCKVDRPWKFYGRINEDTTAYVVNGFRGDLFFSYTKNAVIQKDTQSNKGGLTDFYLNTGTYYKSFMSVIFSPSSVKVGLMGRTDLRFHHKIDWNSTTPKIINEKYKKKGV
nr:MAG TPA: hypothetical protein [Caudoviricetes sp.]